MRMRYYSLWFIVLTSLHYHVYAPEVWITIFVHGIMSIAPYINLQNAGLFIRDTITDTVYARAVNHMRRNPYFFQDQAMQGFGLLPIDIADNKITNASQILAQLYEQLDTMIYTVPVRKNYYYTYGWSGLLSPSQRYIESEGLLIGLYQLIEKFKINNITPKIRIIGYSHGGNVCLNLAAMHRDKYSHLVFAIDELIMIGMPVQLETDTYVASPLFKKAYNIFSHNDYIQKVDFFSRNRFFSNRQFTNRRSFQVPCKLTQIRVKIMRVRKSHKKDFGKQLHYDALLGRPTKQGNNRVLRNASPGHLELWFFGWTADKYRSYFPLYPLPIALFVPYLINMIEQHNDALVHPIPITIDMRPELGYSIIKQSCFGDQYERYVPFVNEVLFTAMQETAQQGKPENTSKEEYYANIDRAIKKARIEYEQPKYPIKRMVGRRKRCNRRAHNTPTAVDKHYKFLEPLS
jgi:hypothetical protein